MKQKVFNVLVLGQSGVGKSTLINSIANYFSFDSFKDALGQQPICIIPASFEIMDSDYNFYKIEIGTPNVNENTENLADSCTQKPKVYLFRHNDININFIDVPGIGDTRGVDTDNTNIKAILDTVSLFDQLHAICILLKSTDTKLTVEYQYCLNELLMHLHQKAIPNVVFVFTNSQASNFVPGNGRTVLAAYLKQLEKDKGIEIPLSKDLLFCIDNDAFRFLCASYQVDAFKDEKYDAYVDSWNRSQRAVKTLFSRMTNLVPHKVLHTLSINQARAVILSLIQPLAAISSLIQANAANYETNFDDLVRRLQENLAVTEYELIIEELPRPRTVCTAKKCIGIETINEQITTYYKQICHEACYLTGIPVKRFPEPGLRQCTAMCGFDYCQWCNCSYAEHMHIDFNQKKILRPSRVGAELAKLGNVDKAKATTNLKQQLQALEHEQKVVSGAMIKFAAYLKKNAIFEYNNAFEERMKMEIRNEEVAVQNGASNVALERLKNTLDDYVEKKKKMEATFNAADGSEVVDSTEVTGLMNDLFVLPLYGEKIKELYDKNTTSNVKRNEENHFVYFDLTVNPF